MFHINCMSWVKFSIRAMYIMLPSICKGHKHMSREGHTVLICINNIAFASVPRNCDSLNVKNTLVKPVYCIMEYTISSLV